MKTSILSLLLAPCVLGAPNPLGRQTPDRRQMHHQGQWNMPAAPLIAPAPLMPAAPMIAPAPLMQPAPMIAPAQPWNGYNYGVPIAQPAPVVPLPAAPLVAPAPVMAAAPLVAPAPVMAAPVYQAPVPIVAPAPMIAPPALGTHIYDHNVVSVPVHVPVEPPVCGLNTIYNSLMTSCQQCPDGTTANASRTACVLAMFCGVGEVPMSSGQGCQQCQPGTHPDPTGTFCQGPPPIEVFFAPTPQPQPETQVTYHPEQVVTPNAVTVKHDTTYQTGAYNWNSSAQPTTHWNGASQGFMGGVAAPVVAGGPIGLPMGAPVMAGVPGMIGAPMGHY